MRSAYLLAGASESAYAYASRIRFGSIDEADAATGDLSQQGSSGVRFVPKSPFPPSGFTNVRRRDPSPSSGPSAVDRDHEATEHNHGDACPHWQRDGLTMRYAHMQGTDIRRAGMPCIRGGFSEQDLYNAGARRVYADAAELHRSLDELGVMA
jgi:hypothetical protein